MRGGRLEGQGDWSLPCSKCCSGRVVMRGRGGAHVPPPVVVVGGGGEGGLVSSRWK